MIRFMDQLKKSSGNESASLCLNCDRGYISWKNLQHTDQAGIGYILMLRTNFGLYEQLADSVIDTIKSYRHELVSADGDERYGMARDCTLYEGGTREDWSIKDASFQRHWRGYRPISNFRLLQECPSPRPEGNMEETMKQRLLRLKQSRWTVMRIMKQQSTGTIKKQGSLFL